MSSNRACLCVVAWRQCPELYQTLAAIPGLDVYVLSHLPKFSEGQWLSELLPSERVLWAPNLGYDWGGYQQFITTGIHHQYDFVFFSHDDIVLLDQGLFRACEELIASRDGSCVVGNGRASDKRDYPRTHIHCYAHSHWKPPSWDFCHDTVRGSFFATSSQALDRIGDFEVLWDRRGFFGVGAGNWSLPRHLWEDPGPLRRACLSLLERDLSLQPLPARAGAWARRTSPDSAVARLARPVQVSTFPGSRTDDRLHEQRLSIRKTSLGADHGPHIFFPISLAGISFHALLRSSPQPSDTHRRASHA